MIFELASSTRDSWIALYHESSNGPLLDRTSYREGKTALERPAVSLSRVCRQIHANTTTLIYHENCFDFQTFYSMKKWRSLRIRAQREVICWLMEPRCDVDHQRYEGIDVVAETRKICPNLIELEEDEDWVRECLCVWYGVRTHLQYE
jgi:hypothetical protein